MENRPYSVSRNVSNGISIMEKNPYNDVLSGQPKFGVPSLSPRLDDYSEMFGGFLVPRGSSIPVLDLPVIDEADACFDVRRLDYSDVFGGFNDLDFAVEFDELLSQAKNREVSSEESWTPIESDCLSEESYPSACSRKSESLSNGDPHPASNGAKQFSVAYQANKSEEMLNEAHVTELHALPGFTCVIDETHSLHKTKCQNPTLQVNGGEKLSVDLAAQEVEKKKLRRSMSHPSNNITGRHAFDGEFDLQNRYNQNGLDTSRTFLTISEISLKTVPSHLPPPSRPPPTLDVRKGTCSNHASEGIAGDSSAPFFDVELDASSSAEISAAAMKAAMEKAQARLKSAKESIEKKKGGLQCGMKNGSKNDIKDKGRKASNVFDVSSNSVDDDKTFRGREDDDICSFIKEEGEIVKRTTRVASEPVKEKDPGLKKGSAEDKGSKQSLLSHKCCNGKGPGVWEEEKYFFEVINTDRPKYDVDHATSNNILMLNTEPHEHGHKKRIADVEVFDQQVGVGKKINPVTPVFEKFEVEKKEKPVKERPKLEVHEKKPCTAQEDFKQEWCEQNETITREQVITKKQQREADNWEKQEILMEGHLYANEVEVEILRHNKKEQKAPCVNGRVEARKHQEKEQIYKDANQRIINDRKLNGAFEREGEKSVHGFFDQEEHERRLKQAFHHAQLGQRHKQPEEERLKKSGGCKKNERKQKEACKKEKNEARVKDGNEGACGIEQRDKRLKDEKEKDIHGKEEMEERLEGKQQQSHEDKEHEKLAKDSKQEKACEKKEYEKRLRNAELKGKQPAALENGIHKKNEGDACGRDACEMRLREASAGEEMKQRVEFFEQEESVQELSERKEKGCEESEEELKASLVGESLRGLQNSCEKSVRNANEQNAELVEGTYERVEGEIVKPADPLSNAEQKPLFQATEGACRCEENSISMEVKPKILADADIGENLKAGLEDDEGEVRKDEKPSFPIDDKLKSSTVQSFFMDETPKQYGRPVDGIGETLGSIDPVNKKSEVSGEKGSNSDQKENQDRFDLSAQAEKEETENRNKIGPAHEEKNPRGREKLEDKEKERRLRRERELELECLSKLEDEREREREREKDRMDIERATREACGRAYAVERATVEARQRALSETRDRLGRAAAERVASEARERLERSLSMRNSEMRQRSSSPGHGSDNAKSEGVEGESAQRCKAKLERYRRTTERAEKALAEKNMRDLLAQREQAERNRLAESLDAEVKRWSSGKEGNLRALLSTLQYILGLDSGWQPVPLTEVITSAAVKKAYRKATLCVHPDKLQQRGASIQHKYICEKVFDLLKESWNKFNSEER